MSVIKVSEDGQSSYNQQGGYGLLIYSYDTHDNICIETPLCARKKASNVSC